MDIVFCPIWCQETVVVMPAKLLKGVEVCRRLKGEFGIMLPI